MVLNEDPHHHYVTVSVMYSNDYKKRKIMGT